MDREQKLANLDATIKQAEVQIEQLRLQVGQAEAVRVYLGSEREKVLASK